MALFRKFFYRKPPDGLLEISERVYVFDCCFSTDVLEDDDYKVYMGGIVSQLREHFPDASFVVFNFREGERQSQIANILSEYDMTVMDYPRQYEGCPLLTMEMVHHFLRSSESWLSLGQQNLLLMHCERGGWPVLAFMLAALLIYRKQYTGEQRTLEMIYKQAPRELLQLLSPLNPLPSQLRYLQYVSRRNVASEWPPLDRALTLDCVILRILPDFDGEGGCRPIFRIYGQDPFIASDRNPKVLFSTPKKSKSVRHYKQADCELVKIDIHCHIQGDVVLECISLEEDLEREEMMFRVMFNTAFIRSNILMLNRDDIDILWNAKDRFPRDFRAEVLLSDMDTASSLITMELASSEDKEGLPVEAFAKVQEIFSNVDWLDPKGDAARQVIQQITSSNHISDKLDITSQWKVESMQESSLVLLKQEKQQSHASENRIRKSLASSLKQQSVASLNRHLGVNMTEQNSQIHDFQVSITSQLKIMSQRMAVSSRSAPASHSNSLLSSPIPISRYHSAPSALGITALLHDHAAYGSGETDHSATQSPPSLSAVASHPEPDNHSTPSVISAPVNSTLKSSDASPPPLVPSPGAKLPSLATTASKSSKITFSQEPYLPPPPSPPPPTMSQQTLFQPVGKQHSPLTPPPPPPPLPLPRSPSKQLLASESTGHVPPPHLEVPFSARGLSTSVPLVPPLPPPPPPPFCERALSSIASTLPPCPTGSKINKPPPPPPPPPPAVPSPTCSKISKRPPPPPPPPPAVSSAPFAHPSKKLDGIAHAPPPPPPPPPSSRAPLPPPPPPPPPPPSPPPPLSSKASPSPPPPPPLIPRAAAPPPPPPPPPSSRAAAPPPPPPPPQTELKNSPSPSVQKSSHIPPVPPPPISSGIQGPPKAPATISQSGPFTSRGGPIPPAPPEGMGAPMSSSSGIKGRTLTRSSSPRNVLSPQSSSKKSSLKPLHWIKVTRAMQGSIWAETQKHDEASKAPEFDMSELESLFSAAVPTADIRASGEKSRRASIGSKSDKIHLIDLRRANNCEIMLTKVKIPLPDLMSSLLALDDSVLDVDQVDNLIKFCPTKEEMELLKGFNGDKENLGKCEQFFLELMKVPRVESKLRVFSFKIQFRSQVADLSSSLNIVNSAADEIRGSTKLKRIMQTILSLGNALNQGTARGSAIGFRLDSLLKLTDTRARNNKMTLMHYLCKVLADKLPELLDFHRDLVSLEAASKIQLKTLAEEMQAISKGLEKVEQELTASENDGPVSRLFCQNLKDFLITAEAEVRTLTSLYSGVGRNADALALYFGEDPVRCPFEQVVSTLLNFVKMFGRAHEENCKQLELERKKAQKEAENEKLKISALRKESDQPMRSPIRSSNTK